MALGMESGRISDSQISASSEYEDITAAAHGRLNFQEKGAGWAAVRQDANQWLQVDLNNEHTSVMSVATQGRTYQDHYQCVKSYKLQSSNDSVNFRYYREQGNATDKVFIYIICVNWYVKEGFHILSFLVTRNFWGMFNVLLQYMFSAFQLK